MVVSISSGALQTGEGFAAIASEERLGSDREGETMSIRESHEKD
jgi:hypothetical protein